MLKVGDKFWEYNKHLKTGYPRWAHSPNHVEYFYKHYKDFTFYSEEEMNKCLKEREKNKNDKNQKILQRNRNL